LFGGPLPLPIIHLDRIVISIYRFGNCFDFHARLTDQCMRWLIRFFVDVGLGKFISMH
jgi:hypothetical protein